MGRMKSNSFSYGENASCLQIGKGFKSSSQRKPSNGMCGNGEVKQFIVQEIAWGEKGGGIYQCFYLKQKEEKPVF